MMMNANTSDSRQTNSSQSDAPQTGSQKYNSIRLFKNPILEAFTHVHPSIPFILWVPAILFLIYYSAEIQAMPLGLLATFFLAGLFIWTITEYGMHRYVFHFPATSKAGKYLVFLFHGIHHDDPQDPTRLVMPPIISLTLGPLFYLLFRVIFGASNGVPLFCGFMTGYLIYDYIHFATHHFRPRTQWGKALKENHMKHHFLEKKVKWGVSSPLWDHIFRTY